MHEMIEQPVRRVAMLSTHGYFDPVPQLGRTDTGGQVVYVLELAKALAGLGIPVDIYTRWFDRTQPQIDSVPGHPDVRVIRIQAGPWEFIAKEFIYDVLDELSENMVKFIREKGLEYDLYHGHYVDAGIVTLNVSSALQRPAFFTAHSLGAWKRSQMGGDPDEMERKFNFEHRIDEELRIFKEAAAQTMTTEVQREKLAELYGYEAANIEVIPPGVDVDLYRPLGEGEAEPDIGMPERYVFCLSRIDSNKGHDLLLNAWDRVRKEVDGVDLVIGGGSPKPQERERKILDGIQAIIEEKGLTDRVRMTGYVPDEKMAPSYRQAELFVLPSLFEPFGMTVLEAMSCGTPVVASRLGGIRSVVNSSENGILVDPSDAREFAEGMTRLLKSPEEAKKIGRAGRETVVQSFSWKAIAVRHLAFLGKYL
jgi:mannosylfructose-phosphate synthase